MKCITLAEKLWFSGDSTESNKDEPTTPGSYAFNVYALGGLGGRVDQSFHSLHHLHVSNNISSGKIPPSNNNKASESDSKEKESTATKSEAKSSSEPSSSLITEDDDYLYLEQRPTLPHTLTLISFTSPTQANLTFLVPEGWTQIRMSKDHLGPALGIIPMLGATELSTRGLVYDVDKWITEFGNKVSTSNYLWTYNESNSEEYKETNETRPDHGESIVNIGCDKPVIITIEIRSSVNEDDEDYEE